MEVKAPLDADDDGFLTQECPYCNRQFKALFGTGSRMHLRFCPYCGTEGQHAWYTIDQIRYLESRTSKGTCDMPEESDAAMPVHRFSCHRDQIKYDDGEAKPEKLYCIVCGKRPPRGKKPAARKARK